MIRLTTEPHQHDFRLVRIDDAYAYEQCRCGERRYRAGHPNGQPPDRPWLSAGNRWVARVEVGAALLCVAGLLAIMAVILIEAL